MMKLIKEKVKEIKTDNNIEAQFFSAMIDLLLLVEQKEMEKLKEYEDLEAQGLLLKLPCKIGDMIYAVSKKGVIEYEAKDYCLDEGVGVAAVRVLKTMEEHGYSNVFYTEHFGKTVFLTREEAEAAFRKNEA